MSIQTILNRETIRLFMIWLLFLSGLMVGYSNSGSVSKTSDKSVQDDYPPKSINVSVKFGDVTYNTDGRCFKNGELYMYLSSAGTPNYSVEQVDNNYVFTNENSDQDVYKLINYQRISPTEVEFDIEHDGELFSDLSVSSSETLADPETWIGDTFQAIRDIIDISNDSICTNAIEGCENAGGLASTQITRFENGSLKTCNVECN